MIKKVKNKIVISNSILFFILILFLLIFFNDLVRTTNLKMIKREMTEKLRFLNLVLEQNLAITTHNKTTFLGRTVNDISGIIKHRITIIGFDGIVLTDSDMKDVSKMDNHKYRIEIRNSMQEPFGYSIRYSNTLNIDMLYVATRSSSFIIRLATPLFEVRENLAHVRRIIIIVGIALFIVSMIVLNLLSRKITRPIDDSVKFAEDFSRGDYSRRILNYSDDEIGILQMSLNKLADVIVEKIDSLIMEQNKLSTTIETIHEGIAVIDADKRIVVANKYFSVLMGLVTAPEQRMYYEVVRGSSLNSWIERCLINGEQAYFEETLHDGTICDVYINPVRENNLIKGILLVLHDVTEKKKIEQVKTDLVGNMSHELKTPIAILKGYLETISEHLHDPETCAGFIKKAVRNVERQNTLVNDMLKLNLLETSEYIPEEDVNLKELIDECIDILQPKIVMRDIIIKKNNIDLTIQGNRFLSQEVFFNVIENAINYNNEKGEIRISAEKRINNTIELTVFNTGTRIPNESLGKIFQRFYRVDKSRSRSTGGTGLGLAIVKHASEMLNWKISVTSNEEGTAFVIKI